jgi:DNA-binding transcriptional regulator YiaG
MEARGENNMAGEMDSGRGDQIELDVRETLKSMSLEDLRQAKELTQTQLAQVLQVSQGAVSKAERRTDMHISTLRSYLRAIGGDLEIHAVFPEGEVLIDQFEELDTISRSNPETELPA